MQFCQLDRIRELVPGQKVVAVKSLTLAESYLKDHFPRFPVMPGVLMMEAMFQAGMWLIYATNQFSRSTVVLSDARQVRFTDFVQPGNQLVVTTEWGAVEGDSHSMQASATIGDSIAVRARLTLDYYNLAERGLASSAIDRFLVKERIEQFRRLQDPRNPFNLPFAYANDTDASVVS